MIHIALCSFFSQQHSTTSVTNQQVVFPSSHTQSSPLICCLSCTSTSLERSTGNNSHNLARQRHAKNCVATIYNHHNLYRSSLVLSNEVVHFHVSVMNPCCCNLHVMYENQVTHPRCRFKNTAQSIRSYFYMTMEYKLVVVGAGGVGKYVSLLCIFKVISCTSLIIKLQSFIGEVTVMSTIQPLRKLPKEVCHR